MDKTVPKKSKISSIQAKQSKIQTSFSVRNVQNGYFPYQPYPEQHKLISEIHCIIKNNKNGLIQSPTGTGKTLCMLVGSLSSLMSLNSETKQVRQKIYYLTRTHSQISQVINELKKTAYNCSVNIIGSRDSLCLNKNLQAFHGRNLDRACQQICSQKLCKFRQETSDSGAKKTALSSTNKFFKEFHTIEQIRQIGRKNFICPYYASKKATDSTNITIMPYNYLLDWNLFEKLRLNIKNSVIIFDEAHNIDTLAEEGSSLELSTQTINQAVKQLNALGQSLKCRYLHKKFQDEEEETKIITGVKYAALNMLNQLKQENSSKTKGEVLFHNKTDILNTIKNITKFTNPQTGYQFMGINLGNYEDYIDDLRKISKMFSSKKIASEFYEYYVSYIDKMFKILDSEESEDYIMIISAGRNNSVLLKFHCLNAAFAFERIKKEKPKSILLCSGTLSPLETWQKDLGVQFHSKIEIPSFVKKNQVYATILTHNMKNQSYDFSFQKKKRECQYQSLGQQLSKLQQVVPNGIVVAFSTYQLMEKSMKHCLKLKKKVFYQSKNSNAEQIYQKYSKQCYNNGAFLFIIMKGRFAEGINFNDQLCRCLVVVGIPFLPMMDYKISKKQSYLESKFGKQHANQWYLNQTFRTVNQAIGRVIRSKVDYGSIILLDQRFQRKQIISEFPFWFRTLLKESNINNYDKEIQRYFENKTWEQNIQKEIKHEISSDNFQTFEKQLQRTIKSHDKAKQSLSLQQLLDQETPIKNKKTRKLKITQDFEEHGEYQKPTRNLKKQKPKSIDRIQNESFEEKQNNSVQQFFPWLSVDYFLNGMNLCQSSPNNLPSIDTNETTKEQEVQYNNLSTKQWKLDIKQNSKQVNKQQQQIKHKLVNQQDFIEKQNTIVTYIKKPKYVHYY